MVGFSAVGLSAVALGAQSVAATPGPDTTAPTLSGPLDITAITQTGAHIAWPAGADNVAIAAYERSVDTGTVAWQDVGTARALDIVGLAPGTLYTVRVRVYDTATPRNYSAPITAQFRTASQPPEGIIDASTVSAARTVVFSGGTRVVTFQGGTRVVVFGNPQ